MVLTDSVDVGVEDRLEPPFLVDDAFRRLGLREARMEADFPPFPGEGARRCGELGVFEVGKAPREQTVPKALLGLRALVEHEECGTDSGVAFDIPNRIEAPIGPTTPTAPIVLLSRPVETLTPGDVCHVLERLATAVDIVGQADREWRASGPL